MKVDCVNEFIYLFYLSNYDFMKRLNGEGKFSCTCIDGVHGRRVDDGMDWYNMSTIVGFFKTMGFLLDELERNGLMLLKIDIEKVYWVNYQGTSILFYTDFNDVMKINSNGNEITVMTPFKKTPFLHSRMQSIDILPINIDYHIIYHNLGYIVYWLLFRDGDFDTSKIALLNGKDGEASELCNRLKYSLMRCINDNIFIWI